MQPQLLLPTILSLLVLPLTNAQLAQGGGIAPAVPAPSQYPVVSALNSLVTVGGVTTTKNIVFTQTFAATALGTWDLGPTPLVGSIGLGDIQGEVGKVKSVKNKKRAIPTAVPQS